MSSNVVKRTISNTLSVMWEYRGPAPIMAHQVYFNKKILKVNYFNKTLTALIPHNCWDICMTRLVIKGQRNSFNVNNSTIETDSSDLLSFASLFISSNSYCTFDVFLSLSKAFIILKKVKVLFILCYLNKNCY